MSSNDARTSERQLDLIAEVACLLDGEGLRFWLSGGWAVDFHAGRVTRPHSDVDIIVHYSKRFRLAALLEGAGLDRAGERPGIVWFQRGDLRLEVTFIRESEAGLVTPGYEGWPWPDGSFPTTVVTFAGVSVRAVSVDGLLDMKRGFAERLGRPRRSYDSADIETLEKPE